MSSFKAFVASILVYLRDNPGAVSLMAGEAVLVFAHFGLKLSAATLASAVAVALPILLGYFSVAKKASTAAAVKRAEVAKAGDAEALKAIEAPVA